MTTFLQIFLQILFSLQIVCHRTFDIFILFIYKIVCLMDQGCLRVAVSVITVHLWVQSSISHSAWEKSWGSVSLVCAVEKQIKRPRLKQCGRQAPSWRPFLTSTYAWNKCAWNKCALTFTHAYTWTNNICCMRERERENIIVYFNRTRCQSNALNFLTVQP